MYKKRFFSALVLLCVILLVGCSQGEKTENLNADYSEYPFVNETWVREAEHDSETLRFNGGGHFVYYCSCGNPVNDSDLCKGYVYDDATKTITLNCYETTDEMVTTIKILKCDENSLHLDFDGETRIFEKEINSNNSAK